MRVYLDNCRYNRPYDEQGQLRVRLETEAKMQVAVLMNREPWDYTEWRRKNLYLDGDVKALAERSRRDGAAYLARLRAEGKRCPPEIN